ncbi:Histidine phosphatase family protein [Sulfidibacter corallicola]|uniref:Histidine phosphatase family protein n=1 Tax=Sulfidibacter corallicola TaxID=2818388 RepID=A0A8A4TQY9_SULCO|nr:histidine phosphatase family protein [Sulfidibacter corallicola]QTD52389.1 histidine phosphatase family protein [Sulfidibacter corallicola]
MEIFLVRHPPVHTKGSHCYGSSDVPLIPEWQKGARAALSLLPESGDAQVWTSPLGRCTQMADLYESQAPRDARLREMDFGSWENRLWRAIPRAEVDAWVADIVAYRPPDGESFFEVIERVREFWGDRLRPESAQPVVIFTHAGVIKALLAVLAGLAPHIAARFQLDYNSVTKIGVARDWARVDFVNRVGLSPGGDLGPLPRPPSK